MILNTTTHPMKTGLIFPVPFYSTSGVLSVKWYQRSEVIHNSNKWRQDTQETTVNISIYGQLVALEIIFIQMATKISFQDC